ncbi:MAG: hypothetical protein JWQ35_2723 [Bacteriovoracaceae bacterium]|nr:hypothetical protein [Bacteriovoracaceae bacterium]
MQPLRIKILGTRGYIPESACRHRKHSGVLIESLLFDLGEKEFLKYNPKAIFITHFHPDHAFFVTDHLECRGVPIYAPEKLRNYPQIQVIKKSIRIGKAKVTPIPTIHSIRVKSQGYLIEMRNKKIFYSSDLITVEKKFRNLFSDLDLVITDGSFFKKGGLIRRFGNKIVGHNGMAEIIKLFRPYTSHIIFMHFGSWFIKNPRQARSQIKSLSEEVLKIEASFDGQVFEF